jgi:hypothetical protein
MLAIDWVYADNKDWVVELTNPSQTNPSQEPWHIYIYYVHIEVFKNMI